MSAETQLDDRTDATGPRTMRIVRQRSLGGPDVLELTQARRPEPGPTEVLVRTAAAGINPVGRQELADRAQPARRNGTVAGGTRPQAGCTRPHRLPRRGGRA